jgi:hypothetical protein
MFRTLSWSVIINILSVFLTGIYGQYPQLENQKKIADQQIEELSNFSEYVLGKDYRLVNGRIYTQPFMKAYGHPFFKDVHWMSGSVSVNGKTFTGLQLNYDIFNDQLIFLDESPDGSKKIILLNKDQVKGFTIEDHSFIKLEPLDINNISESQYYEFLVGGKISLLKKWDKEFESNATQEYPKGKFSDTKSTRLILKNRQLFKINSSTALLKVCGDKKEEMKKFLRKNKINVRQGSDQKLIGLIKYYNSLISE